MPRTTTSVSGLALVVFAVAHLWLASLERAGPAHADVMLEGGVPATLYLPWPGDRRTAFGDPPPLEERPPLVVVMHGLAGDRITMSGLSRRLAASGYAVLAFDARGHGENRNPFSRSWPSAATFEPDLRAAVDFARGWPFADGGRIAVLGHSMGAGASLDYATRDSGIDAAILISGGWRLEGPYRPANALFLVADGDPERTRQRVRGLASQVAGVALLEEGATHGRHDRLDAVRLVEIAGENHQSIVSSDAAVAEIVTWLDMAFAVDGVEGMDGEPGAPPARLPPVDRRSPALALLALACLFVLPGVGGVVGRIAPVCVATPATGRWRGVAAVGAAVVVTLPLMASGTPAAIVSAEVADVLAGQLGLAGLVLLVGIRMLRPHLFDGVFERVGASLAAGAVGLIAIFVLSQPFGVAIHRATLTPERIWVFGTSLLGFLPFALAFQLLVRRGAWPAVLGAVVVGRVLVLALLAAGAVSGVLGSLVLLLLPAVAFVFVLIEIIASPLYAASRNGVALALLDAGLLAYVLAAAMPVRI